MLLSKDIVLIDKGKIHEKVMQFIQDNNIKQIKTGPSTKFEKQTQKIIQYCKKVINRKIHKHLINTQSKATNSMPTKKHKLKTCL